MSNAAPLLEPLPFMRPMTNTCSPRSLNSWGTYRKSPQSVRHFCSDALFATVNAGLEADCNEARWH